MLTVAPDHTLISCVSLRNNFSDVFIVQSIKFVGILFSKIKTVLTISFRATEEFFTDY